MWHCALQVFSYSISEEKTRKQREESQETNIIRHVLCCTGSNNVKTRSSAIAEGPRDASCQLKSCQLPRNSAETTYTSPDQIDGMKLEI